MKLEFYKYQGTGNDFVIIDDRNHGFKNNTKTIKQLCDRKFGIGADGLILLQKPEGEVDFKMVYFNADGNESSLCGNGSRCAAAFARFLGIIGDKATFTASDGLHKAKIDSTTGLVHLKMRDLREIKKIDKACFIDTGSPHHVVFAENISGIDVKKEGAKIRNSDAYAKDGVNVNFVETDGNSLSIRTYERGVENETLSCGTGVVAAALGAHFTKKTHGEKIVVKTLGGKLMVEFKADTEAYYDIWLTGPAEQVFKGEIEC